MICKISTVQGGAEFRNHPQYFSGSLHFDKVVFRDMLD